ACFWPTRRWCFWRCAFTPVRRKIGSDAQQTDPSRKEVTMLRSRLLQMPRQAKRALQVFADTLLLWAALWLAFVIRLGWERMVDPFGEYLWLFIAAPAAAIPLFVRFGLYRAVLRYFGSGALVTIFNAISLSALLLALIIYLMRPDEL